MNKGLYVVIQGVQGTGKSTQIVELNRRFQAAGLPVRMMREPDSQTDLTARTVRAMTQSPRYPMNTKTEVLLYNAARSQTLDIVKNMTNRGVSCIVDHSYLTTLAVQYYGRGDIDDYEAINQIIKFTVADMEPDLIVIIDIPVDESLKRLKNRGQGEKFDNLPRDFLERERNGLLKEAKLRGLPIVDGTKTVEALADDIWSHVSNALKSQHSRPRVVNESTSQSQAASLKEILREKKLSKNEAQEDAEPSTDAPLIKKNQNGSFSITDEGREYLSDAVTNTEDNVYVFTDKMSNVTVAAAMARLSRRGDDMRVTLLDEFAGKAGKDEGLLKRVITAYGDDSVQQLSGIHFVIEGASNWLTKKLEWGRLAAYLEQSTRYIYFDQKDEKGNYKYFTPKNLNAKIARSYEQTMDKIFDTYSEMVHELTDYVRKNSNVPKKERDFAWKGATRAQACDAIRPVLPVSTKSTVGIYASGQALESLIMHLQGETMQEARETGDKLLEEARKVVPVFLERADKPDRGGATIAYSANTKAAVKKIADEKLSPNMSPEANPVMLNEVWPKNEMDLLPNMLYEHSSLSLREIEREVAEWSYEDRLAAFKAYVGERLNRRHKPGRALEQARYSWDLMCDYGIFRDLQRHRMVDDLNWQLLTPRYGYEIPELVEEAGLSELFEKCFDMSYKLYSQMQAAGYEEEAQYATLMGHRMRWKVTYNARQAFHFHELRTTPQGHPGYRRLVKQMHDTLAEHHPLIAESMKFVNKDEDPKLTRLAAERYTQFKLKQLEKISKQATPKKKK